MNYSLFENIDIPAMVVDKCGRIQYVNRRIEDLFSLCSTAFVGKLYSNTFDLTSLNSCIGSYIEECFLEVKEHKTVVDLNIGNGKKFEVCFNPLVENSLFVVLFKEIDYSAVNSNEVYSNRYYSLFDNVKAGVVVYEAIDGGDDFIFKEVNKEAGIIDSFDRDEVLGKSLTNIFPGAKEFGLLDVLKRVWISGKSEKHPISLYSDSRRIGWRSNFVYKLNTGEVVALYTDETNNIKAKDKFLELNKWFSLFLDNFPGYAYIRDIDGEVYYSNKHFKQDINIYSEQGENIKNHKFSIEDLNEFRKQDVEVLAEKKSKSFEDIVNGCYLLTTKFPISFGNKNGLIGAISVDISQMRNSEIQLTKLNEFKNILLSLIAHDLKSPFNVQLGFLEMLINDYYTFDDEKRLEYLKIIYDSTSNSFQLLNDLLEWSNSNINDVKCEPVLIQLKPIVDRVIQQNSLNLSVKKLDIVSTIPENIEVLADENMLEVVIRNIFVNAIKFSKPYGDIKIKAECTEQEIVIDIEDNGIGMDDSIIGKLFEMNFNKVRNGTKGERGTGLGLYLCNEFMKKNNGRIKVESKINEGSRFSLYLPCSE